MRGMRIIAVILLVTTWIAIEGCAGTTEPPASKPVSETTSAAPPTSAPASPPPETTPVPTPAKFEITSLFVPSPIMAGENISVKAIINNIGGSEGTYPITLIVDGISVEKKDVTIAAGASQTVTFTLTKDKPGSYKISVEQVSQLLVVTEKTIELKWDDGKQDFNLTNSEPGRGYLVGFFPPTKSFIIKQVQIFGFRNPYRDATGKTFTIAIWNKEMKPIYESTYLANEFTTKIAIPNVEVNDKFYVHFVPWGAREFSMGVDNSTANQHSYWTENIGGTYRIRYQWLYSLSGGTYIDQTSCNWMIRVVGSEGTAK